MGQVFESQKKENFVRALIDGDIKYIKNNFKEEIDKWNFKDLYVDSPYVAPDTGDSSGALIVPYQSPVNILERVVYEAKHDNEEIWNMMIYNGADENLIGKFVQEPVSMIRGLISENYYWNRSVVEAAILDNKPNLVKVLIKYGANINCENPQNKNLTPIKLAFSENKNDIIKIIILKKGVNYINNNGQTFLHLSVKYENIEIVKFLIENNANLNIKDNWDDTPLFDAHDVNNVEIFNLLVKKGADLTKKNKKGQLIKQVLELEKKRLIMEYEKFCSDKFTLELSGKIKFFDWKMIYEKTDNDSIKKIIGKIISKDEMLNIIENYNRFDSDYINSTDYRNHPSTSKYQHKSPKM